MSWFRSGTNNNGNGNNNHHGNTNYYYYTTNSSSSYGQQLSVKECIKKALYPKTTHFDRHLETTNNSSSNGAGSNGNCKSRFSQLLLEHGEQRIQDWAVTAYSIPVEGGTDATTSSSTDPSQHRMHGRTSADDANTATSNTIQWMQSPFNKATSSTNSSSTNNSKRGAKVNYSGNVTNRDMVLDKDTYPSLHMNKVDGRIHLCTKSIVFEPNDLHRCGIIRCPYHKMINNNGTSPVTVIPQPNTSLSNESQLMWTIEYTSRRHIVMKHHNTIGPHTTVSVPCRFRFTFLYSSPTLFVELCTKLFSISTSTSTNNIHKNRQHRTSASSTYTLSPELDLLLKPMLDRPFDMSNIVDVVREQVISSSNSSGSIKCAITTPLQSRSGTLLVTNERIYFQPAMGITLSSSSINNGYNPTDNVTTPLRADYWLQKNVIAYARRYNGLRDSALEIYWYDESSTLFSFDRRHDREQVLHCLLSVSSSSHNHNNTVIPCLTDREFVAKVVQEWLRGNISNYDYILALNCAAGRSFHDLSRYPVFPWVIADYESTKLDLNKESTFRDLSKPIGALNNERLQYFKTRLTNMQDMDEAFLYGTHYSAPGYVLYFLIRSMPEHMLCLQNGKFDTPDRIFDSIGQCYNSVLTNHADVKELIPEFYNDKNDYDFLINVKGLQLGATQNGDRVNDVKLPPWSRSAKDFIKKNRKALESDICTRMLPRWLDLIFGCKSRGEGAIEADNIFHHNAYLGPTDLADMQTDEERFQAELQATEFGIVPDMLFHSEHPQKYDPYNDDFILPDLGRSSSKEESSHREAWELLDAPATHDQSTLQSSIDGSVDHEAYENHNEVTLENSFHDTLITATNHSSDVGRSTSRNIPLRGLGEILHNDNSFDNRGFVPDPETSLNQATASPIRTHEDSPKIQSVVDGPSAASEWDIRIIERKQIHGDTISGCILFLDTGENNLSILVTTSLDGGLMVHKVALDDPSTDNVESSSFVSPFSRFTYNNILSRAGQISQPTKKLTEYRTHSARDPLASLVLASDGDGGSVAFAGGHDDVVLAYGIKSACAVASVYSHRDAVTGLALITRTPFDRESTMWLENSTHILVSGSWDATIKVWSVSVASGETVAIHREPLAELFDADSSIVSVSAQSIPLGGIIIAAGCTDGCFCVWNVHNDGVQVLIHKESARKTTGPCSVVKCFSVGGKVHIFAGYSNGRLSSYSLMEGAMKRENAIALGVAITSLHHTDALLLVGCADGSLFLVPVSSNAHFHSKPTLWKSLHNKNTSPGISSISLTTVRDRCICCTGGNDGSVVLFELKKLDRLNKKD